MNPVKDPVDEWLDGIENNNTRNNYGPYLKKVVNLLEATPETLLERLKADARTVWREVVVKTRPPAMTPKSREITLCALKHFMRYNDIEPPSAKIPKAPKAKPTPYMTWEQALKIADAATPPYRWIFKLQLHCGWGIGEFLQFNAKAENWERAKSAAMAGEEFFRFEFAYRKSNNNNWYTLIPTFVLKEIFNANSKFPLTTTRDKPLDPTNYHSSVVLLESAFRNAAHRAALKLDPMPSPHEFRDTFKTHCTKQNVRREVSEFAMGHKVDPLGYEKCHEDIDYTWSELSKAYGPSPQELGHVAEENRELRDRIAQLEKNHADLITEINMKLADMAIRQGSKGAD